MVLAFLILVFSCALFFFYVQAVCERALRREFSRMYFREIVNAVQLEYPRYCAASASEGRLEYSSARHALKCDFFTLSYLMKNSDPKRLRRSGVDKLLSLYFRLLFACLPICHVFRFKEEKAVLKLGAMLQYFANQVGEKLTVNSLEYSQSNAAL